MSTDRSSPEPYEYQPLNAQEIRLLRLRRDDDLMQHEICSCSLNDTPRYVTLSYTWGAPFLTFGFTVNGNKSLRIRGNLHEFFQVYNDDVDEEEYLWVDQLSINQSSIKERNHQASIMSNIYRGASNVLVWLQLQHWVYELPGLNLSTHTEGSASKAIKNLSQDVYFLRLWVAQEVMLAVKGQIMIGNDRISLERLRKAIAISKSALPNVLRTTTADNLLYTGEAPPFPLQRCIELFCQNNCEDPRDRVYGLMGLIHENERLEIDYLKSTYEVYSDVVVAFFCCYTLRLVQPKPRQTAHLSNIYASTKRQGYLLSALLLSGKMGFVESKVKALRLMLQDLWKPERLKTHFEADSLHHPLGIAMGFESVKTPGFVRKKLN
jgi:hypothetical protein